MLCSESFLARVLAAALSLARSLLRDPTRSPENGAIILYHRPPRASGRARRAIAARQAVSRRSCLVPVLRATITVAPVNI
jgi:hypothetical protein